MWGSKTVAFGALLLGLSATGCKKVVLRDATTYKNEVYFFEMALEQNAELMREHLVEGSCSCDEEGHWSSDLCENTALNILVIERRLGWHVAMMMYLGGLSQEHPGDEPPVSGEEISMLCPERG